MSKDLEKLQRSPGPITMDVSGRDASPASPASPTNGNEKPKEPKKDNEGISKGMQAALLTFLPTIAGALFEGSEGAAAGSKVGLQNFQQLALQEAKAGEAKKAREFTAEENRKTRLAALKANLTKQLAEASKATSERVDKQKTALQKASTSLRKEYDLDPITKQSKGIVTAINRIRSGVENPSAAGDIALLVSFMKIVDEGSTVREGEFATAAEAGSLNDRTRAIYNRIISGERLTAEQRDDFATQAQGLVSGQLKAQDTVNKRYSRLATSLGIDPEKVLFKELAEASKLGRQKKDDTSPEDKKPGTKIVPGMIVKTKDGRVLRVGN